MQDVSPLPAIEGVALPPRSSVFSSAAPRVGELTWPQANSAPRKRTLSPQKPDSTAKRRALNAERSVDAIVQCHEARALLIHAIVRAGTALDESAVVDLAVERNDEGLDLLKMKLQDGQHKVAFVTEALEPVVQAYEAAQAEAPPGRATWDRRLSERLRKATPQDQPLLRRACRQELLQVRSQLKDSLVQLAWLAPLDDGALQQGLTTPADLPAPLKVAWRPGVFVLDHGPDAPMRTFDCVAGPCTDMAIRCLSLQQREAILEAALEMQQAHADAAANPQDEALALALAQCTSRHRQRLHDADTAVKRARPSYPGMRLKPQAQALLDEGDDGKPFVAKSLFERMTGKACDGNAASTLDAFTRYLDEAGVSLAEALSRPSALDYHRAVFTTFARKGVKQLVTPKAVSNERSTFIRLRNAVMDLPWRDRIVQTTGADPSKQGMDYGAFDSYMDAHVTPVEFAAFDVDVRSACTTTLDFLGMPHSGATRRPFARASS